MEAPTTRNHSNNSSSSRNGRTVVRDIINQLSNPEASSFEDQMPAFQKRESCRVLSRKKEVVLNLPGNEKLTITLPKDRSLREKLFTGEICTFYDSKAGTYCKRECSGRHLELCREHRDVLTRILDKYKRGEPSRGMPYNSQNFHPWAYGPVMKTVNDGIEFLSEHKCEQTEANILVALKLFRTSVYVYRMFLNPCNEIVLNFFIEWLKYALDQPTPENLQTFVNIVRGIFLLYGLYVLAYNLGQKATNVFGAISTFAGFAGVATSLATGAVTATSTAAVGATTGGIAIASIAAAPLAPLVVSAAAIGTGVCILRNWSGPPDDLTQISLTAD